MRAIIHAFHFVVFVVRKSSPIYHTWTFDICVTETPKSLLRTLIVFEERVSFLNLNVNRRISR